MFDLCDIVVKLTSIIRHRSMSHIQLVNIKFNMRGACVSSLVCFPTQPHDFERSCVNLAVHWQIHTSSIVSLCIERQVKVRITVLGAVSQNLLQYKKTICRT